MELYLIRHGRTATNKRRAYCGRTDDPLSPEGAAEARTVNHPVRPDLVYVSPMRRTQQTAAILFPQARQEIIPGLQEMDFGAFEGCTADDLADDPAYQRWLAEECRSDCPGGEGIVSFTRRIDRTLRELVARARAAGREQMVLVAHAGTVMAAMCLYARPEREYFQWFTPNCGGFQVELDENAWPEQPVFLSWHPLLPEQEEILNRTR